MISLIVISTIIVTIIFFINKEITIVEYLSTVAIVNLITLIIYALSLIPIPNDAYFASGRIMSTAYYPPFVEEYEESHTVCSGSGKSESCSTYYTTEHAKHHQKWMMYDNLGQEWEISSNEHAKIRSYFGDHVHTTRPNKCTHGGHFDYGDPNLYTYNNDTNIYKYPTSKMIAWFNPIKGTHSLFNEGAGDYVRDYPIQTGTYETNRLYTSDGTNLVRHDIDVLNTKLYESKGANLDIVHVDNFADCNKLEAYWNGGNYNAIEVCVSGKLSKPDNVKVFGYAEDKMLQRDLETLILDEGLTKKSTNDIINLIQKKYIQFDFSQFKYIKRDCPVWVTILAVIAAVISSFVCIGNFSSNYDSRD